MGASLPLEGRLDALTPEVLRELTALEGCDFATALLHRRIVESERHGPFLRALGEPARPCEPLRLSHPRPLAGFLARRCHARLSTFGPNGGSILLATAPRWPGQLCPAWGADHHLHPSAGERPLLAALLQVLAGGA